MFLRNATELSTGTAQIICFNRCVGMHTHQLRWDRPAAALCLIHTGPKCYLQWPSTKLGLCMSATWDCVPQEKEYDKILVNRVGEEVGWGTSEDTLLPRGTHSLHGKLLWHLDIWQLALASSIGYGEEASTLQAGRADSSPDTTVCNTSELNRKWEKIYFKNSVFKSFSFGFCYMWPKHPNSSAS